jgi:GTP cyclohydrolase I
MSLVLDMPLACSVKRLSAEIDPMERSDVDLRAIEAAVRTILRAVGEDPDRPGLVDTPRRVARMYREMFAGLRLDPARHLRVTFPEEYDEIVLVRDVGDMRNAAER